MHNFYGAMDVLIEYVGAPIRELLQQPWLNWSHGWLPEPYNVDLDLIVGDYGRAASQRDETFLVARKDQEDAVRSFGIENCYAIGLPFAYALALATGNVQRELGSLLVIPGPHSSRGDQESNWIIDRRYIDHLRNLGINPASSHVLIYGKDLDAGRGDNWVHAGFQPIRGAGIKDFNSLHTMATLFNTFESVTSNTLGSHLAYASASGCRVSLDGPGLDYSRVQHDGEEFYLNRPDLLQSISARFSTCYSVLSHEGILCTPSDATKHEQWGKHQIGFDLLKEPHETHKFLKYLSSKRRRQEARNITLAPGRISSQIQEKISLCFLRTDSTKRGSLRIAGENFVVLSSQRAGNVSKLKFTDTDSSVAYRALTTDRSQIIRHFVVREFDRIQMENPEIIVDSGCNAGFSTRYFAQRFPDARVIGLEVSAENYEIAKANTKEFGNVEILNLALAAKSEPVGVIEIEPADRFFRTTSFSAGLPLAPAINPPDLIKSKQVSQIDLFRLEIYGAEYEILSEHKAWFAKHCERLVVNFYSHVARVREVDSIQQMMRDEGLELIWRDDGQLFFSK